MHLRMPRSVIVLNQRPSNVQTSNVQIGHYTKSLTRVETSHTAGELYKAGDKRTTGPFNTGGHFWLIPRIEIHHPSGWATSSMLY